MRTLILIALLALSFNASAGDTISDEFTFPYFLENKDLYQLCDSEEDQRFCVYYLIGVYEGLLSQQSFAASRGGRKYICIPPNGITSDELTLTYLKYVRNNPAFLREPAWMAVSNALVAAFRCGDAQ